MSSQNSRISTQILEFLKQNGVQASLIDINNLEEGFVSLFFEKVLTNITGKSLEELSQPNFKQITKMQNRPFEVDQTKQYSVTYLTYLFLLQKILKTKIKSDLNFSITNDLLRPKRKRFLKMAGEFLNYINFKNEVRERYKPLFGQIRDILTVTQQRRHEKQIKEQELENLRQKLKLSENKKEKLAKLIEEKRLITEKMDLMLQEREDLKTQYQEAREKYKASLEEKNLIEKKLKECKELNLTNPELFLEERQKIIDQIKNLESRKPFFDKEIKETQNFIKELKHFEKKLDSRIKQMDMNGKLLEKFSECVEEKKNLEKQLKSKYAELENVKNKSKQTAEKIENMKVNAANNDLKMSQLQEKIRKQVDEKNARKQALEKLLKEKLEQKKILDKELKDKIDQAETKQKEHEERVKILEDKKENALKSLQSYIETVTNSVVKNLAIDEIDHQQVEELMQENSSDFKKMDLDKNSSETLNLKKDKHIENALEVTNNIVDINENNVDSHNQNSKIDKN